MTIKFTNDARTTLFDGITLTSTSLNVTSTLNFPTLVDGDYTYLTLSNATEAVKEIVKCTAINGNVLTVIRGEESTTAQSFDSGAHVQLRITAGLINEAIGEAMYDDSALVSAIGLNSAKVSNIAHPVVHVEVPSNAVFTDTDTVYIAPTSEAITYITGLQDALDSKLTPTGDGSQLTGIDALPIQTYQGGNFLTTDGTNATWQGLSFEIDGGSASSIYLPTQLVNGGPA